MKSLRRAMGSLAALSLSAFTYQAVAPTAATAGATPARAGAAASHRAAPTVWSHPNLDTADTATPTAGVTEVTTSTTRSASANVGPAPGFSPACYGDSRSVTPVPANGALDPQSFGAFYSCKQSTWTFAVQTADSWASTSLGAWQVNIDVDGDQTNNGYCNGFEYMAKVVHNGAGAIISQIGQLASVAATQRCQFVGTLFSGTVNITANSVAISFPATDIGSNRTLVWNGILQNRSEQQACPPSPTPCRNVVPASTSLDSSLLVGAVAESLPPTGSPASCSVPGPAAAEVATVGNSQRAAAALRQAGFSHVRDHGEGIVSFSGDAASARGLLAAAGVGALVAPAQTFRPQATFPNDPQYSAQWNLPAIGAPAAWSVTTGNHVVVADIDTGVDYTHPDLLANLPTPPNPTGFDEITLQAMGPGTSEPGNQDTGQNESGHGTAVAGVIAAVSNNGKGVASLGFNTTVLPVKVDFEDLADVSSQIDAGIRWAADNGAQILNLSFGGTCQDPNMLSAIQYAQSKGVLVVAAAGNGALNPTLDPTNGASDAPFYPAAFPGVIAVGATGFDGLRAAYSNTGSYVAMAAPGGSDDGNGAHNLPLLAPDDTCIPPPQDGCYTTNRAGTSFAAPQVAAEAALVWSVDPHLTASQVTELVESTTTDRGVSGTDWEYGTGFENAGTALADTPPDPTLSPNYGDYFPVTPTRILDTRSGLGAPQQRLGPGSVVKLKVTGILGGTITPASSVVAVVLNMTITNSTAPSFLTVWPDGQTEPNVSNLNFGPNQTVPNLVTVKVGPGGLVDIANAGGLVDVIADVFGYFGDGSLGTGSTFHSAASPVRLLDTRTCTPATSPACLNGPGPLAAGVPRLLPITGINWKTVGFIPANATAAVFNVTVVDPTAAGVLTLYPATTGPRPPTSNLNFVPHQTVPNLVSVQLGTITAANSLLFANDRGIDIVNSAGLTHVIVDLEGWFTSDATGSRFFPLVAHRILDTRTNVGGFSAPIMANQSINVNVTGQGGVLDGATGVVMNTTVTAPTQSSFLEVFPSNPRPSASNLNFGPGQTIANLVTVRIGNGHDSFYNSAGTVQAIADVQGWYCTPPSPQAAPTAC
jgi:subtilisin family serine protease